MSEAPTWDGMERRRSSEAERALFRQLEELTQAVRDGNVDLRKLVDCHEETLYGNGRPGLTTRVDRLEQRAESSRWGFRAVAVAVIALVLKIMADAVVALRKP